MHHTIETIQRYDNLFNVFKQTIVYKRFQSIA
jgi:hypothetical protein